MMEKVKSKILHFLVCVLCCTTGCLDDTNLCIGTELAYVPLKKVSAKFHKNSTELVFINGAGKERVFSLVNDQSKEINNRRMNVSSAECSTPLTNTNTKHHYFSIDYIIRTFRYEDFRLVFEISIKDLNDFYSYSENADVDTLNIDYLRVYSRQGVTAEQQKLELIINDRGNSDGDNNSLLSNFESFRYHDSISFLNNDFEDVYESVNDEYPFPILYYSKEKGLIAFEEDDDIWIRK